MRYMGGKSRIAKPISEIISNNAGADKTFVSLFCGAVNVESKVKGFDRIICNDNHEYLIALLQAVQQGYIPPDNISEEQYKHIRNNKDKYPKELVGFVGFGCSFGGRWFEGYARDKNRNYCLEAKKFLLRKMETLKEAEFICGDYRNVAIPQGSVIYADPPYSNTTKYSTGEFNSNEFWEYMRKLAKAGNTVYISEQTAPEDFICIWEKPLRRTLDVNKENNFIITERLYTYGQKGN